MMFYQCRTAFDPVTVVHVTYAVDEFDLGMMYVSTDHTIESTLAAVGGQVAFKLKYEVHGLFDSVLEIAAQAPVAQAQPAPIFVLAS